MLKRRITLPVSMVVVVSAVLLGLGGLVGNQLPWGGKNLTVKQGTATLLNPENGLASFTGDDGDSDGFDADSIWWEAGSVAGDGDPPCLKVERPVHVQVGFLVVNHPAGGSHDQIAWMRCP